MKDDKRLKRKVRNSYIVSTVSIMLVLFLLGSVGYLMVAAMKVAQTLQESIAVTVELQNGISDQQRETINKRLTAEELVATVAYVSKEDKADDAEFRKMFESEFEEILGENPLLDSFELTLTAESADKELLDGFIASVSGIAGVERVSYPALMAERLHATVGKIRLVLLLFGGALLIISLILLSNTIRLAIFSKRYLINTMKLVGATKWFIMKPFLGSSITQGILAGLGASLLFGLSVFGLNEAVPELTTIAESGKIAIILGAMNGIALALGPAVLYALITAVNRKYLGPVDAYGKTIVQLGAAGLVLVPYLLLTGGFAGLRVTPLSAGLMLLVSLTHTAIPYALYFGAMVRLPTQTVALMSYLDPITALLLSALVLHEPLSPAGLAGAALVLGATLLSELWARKKPT